MVDAAAREHGGPDTVAEPAAMDIEPALGRLNEANVLLRTALSYTDSLSFDQPDGQGPTMTRPTYGRSTRWTVEDLAAIDAAYAASDQPITIEVTPRRRPLRRSRPYRGHVAARPTERASIWVA